MTYSPGNIVKIRNRFWRIDSVYKEILQATSIDSYESLQKKFYIPLEIIQPADKDLPDINRVGDIAQQRLFLTSYKLSLLHGSSPLHSLKRSSIIPTNFQLVPLIMALNLPKARLLIADDVGLGKTIEAGLILNELKARHLAKKILVITPANLREQWQEALQVQFKQNFSIISSLHKKYLEKDLPLGASPWEYFDQLICSIDYAKTKANRNEILNQKWDLVIIDEAHLCAKPHSVSIHQNSTMLRWEFLNRISRATNHLLLLTATPHNGYTDSFHSLISALDINAVNADNFTINRNLAYKHVCQRTRHDVIDWLKKEPGSYNPFPEVEKKEVRVQTLNNNEQKLYYKLNWYGEELRKIVPYTKGRDYIINFTILHFLKRFLSSPRAIQLSLKNRLNKLSSSDYDTEIRISEAKQTIVESDNIEDFDIDEAGKRIERSTFSEEVNKFERRILAEAYELAKKIKPRSDHKFKKLVTSVIPELLQNSNRIILFTRYTDTLDYLTEHIKKEIKDIAVFAIHGKLISERRKEILSDFGHSPQNAILIATDCISEGMNLQYLCSQVIHYEIPWNPNRMEQRNGRVDRFGQPQEKVHIRTIIVENTLDNIILKNIIEKSDRMKKDYGFSPPFFSDENKIIDTLFRSGMKPKTRKVKDKDQLSLWDALTKENDEIKDELDSINAELDDKMKQIENESFYGHSNISLPDIEKKIQQTEATIGSPQEIKNFIKSGLNLFHSKIEELEDTTFKITITDNRLQIAGIANPIRKATFDKNYAARNQDCELIDLSHPLVSRLIQLIKKQSIKDINFYGRTAYKGSNVISQTSAFMNILTRYAVKTNPNTMIEEIIQIGFDIYDKKMLSAEIVKNFHDNSAFCQRSTEEVKEELEAAMNTTFWQPFLDKKIETRRREFVQERENLIKKLNELESPPEWVEGLADIEFVRYDILTITIGYPV